VSPVCIKEDDWLNARRRQVDRELWAKNLVNPEHHALLIHPHCILESVDRRRGEFGQSFFSIIPPGLPLKIIIGIKKSPAAVMVNTPVALFVPFDILQM
jgi:hypothetical protein